MNNQEKIEAAGKKKEEGNVLFKSGKFARASKRYEKVIILLTTSDTSVFSISFFLCTLYLVYYSFLQFNLFSNIC